MENFEITKREVLISIIIAFVWIVIGIFIGNSINQNMLEEYQKYDTAMQIDNDKELFLYDMKTNIGNSFVYGELKALDPVTYEQIGGKYSYVLRIKEEYVKTTETETYIDSDGETKTRVVTKHEWKEVKRDSKESTKISFLDVEFQYNKISFPSYSYIATKKISSDKRYKYYGSPCKCNGTIYSSLKNNTINNTKFYDNLSIKSTIDYLESGYEIGIFWFCWIVMMCLIIFGFYYLENNWLEDNKKFY